MRVFHLLLFFFFAGIIVYTVVAGLNHGWDLVSVFFGELSAFSWSGQFNFDFLCYLSLSAIWTAWREKFSGRAIFLAVIALVFGILFFAPYLLYLSVKAKGDVRVLLLGQWA